MIEVIIEKVDKPWQYEIFVDGKDLPFVSKVEITEKTDELGFAKAIITMILPTEEMGRFKIIRK
jgi:hypothetical protein